MSKQYHHLDTNSLASAAAMLAFVLWIAAIIWHGILGNAAPADFH